MYVFHLWFVLPQHAVFGYGAGATGLPGPPHLEMLVLQFFLLVLFCCAYFLLIFLLKLRM